MPHTDDNYADMNVGNFFEYFATGGHPHPVPGWLDYAVWPALIIIALLWPNGRNRRR